MPISPSEFEVVDETKDKTDWGQYEAVPDPKALATGVGAGIDVTRSILGALTSPAAGEASLMGRRQGRQIRADLLQNQAQRAAAMTGGGTVSPTGPGMPALPEEDVAGIKAAITQGPLGLIPEEVPPAPTGPFGAGARPPAFDLAAEAAKQQEPFGLTPSPRPGETFQAPDLKPPSMVDAVTEGVGESALGTADFMLSPAGIATLGMGALTRPMQRLISIAFAGQMGNSMREAAKELGTEFGKPADQRDPKKVSKLLTDIVTGGTFATAAGFHGVGPAADLPMTFMNRFGDRPVEGPPTPGVMLQTPRGAPAPRLEIPGVERATPEEAAAQAKAMQRRATAAFEPAAPEKPVVPETPPEAGRETGILREIVKNELFTRKQLQEFYRRTGGRVPGNEEASRLLKAAWKREDANAISKRGTEAVPVEEPPGDSEKVVEGVRPGEEPAVPQEPAKTADEAQVTPPEEPPSTEPTAPPPTTPPTEPPAAPAEPVAPAAPAGVPAETALEKADREAKEAKEEEGRMIGERVKAEKIKPENVFVTINPPVEFGGKKIPGFVQVDENNPTEGNIWSNKAETLRKYGFDIPSTEELLKLPMGRYTLPKIREIMKGKGETKPAAPATEAPVTETKAAEGATPTVAPAAEPAQAAAAPATPSLAERLVSFVESEATKAEARLKSKGTTFGSGPLHELPNIRDYAIIGAAKLARFGLDKAKFAAEMVKKFGERIRPHLDELFDQSSALFARYGEKVKNQHTPVQEIIDQATGAAKAPKETVSQVIDTMQTSLRTVRALKDHFEGQPKVSRAEVKLADDFLEADANRIRESLGEYVKANLPVSERGRFLTAIGNATKRSPILTGDPEAMYRRAAQVAARIENRAVEVQQNTAIADIKKNVEKALASPTVDLTFKSKIGDLVKRFSFSKPTEQTLANLRNIRDYIARQEAQGKDVAMPKAILDSLELLNKVPIKDLPLHVLEAMRDRIALLEEMGRRTVATRELRWENEKAIKNRELTAEPTNPIEKRPELQPQPGDPTPFSMRLGNKMRGILNAAARADKALLPIDALFDLLGDAKGAYKGWLFKNVRNPIDLAFNQAQVDKARLTAPVDALVDSNNMGKAQAERIGVYAIAKQEGGVERLKAMGVTPERIAEIQKGLTPSEMAVYNEMRKALDSQLPKIQRLMHELYNIPVEPVENYFPMPRDWKVFEQPPEAPKQPKFGEAMDFDELAGWKEMLGDFTRPKTTKTEQGFTIERQKGAETPVKINAFDVFQQHINDVSYLLNTQRNIKMIGELAKEDLFSEKYGKVGQSLVLNWLDTVARQGKTGSSGHWSILDTLRKNTSAGVIGFRIASQFVHLSNVPLSMQRTGVLNYNAGLLAAFSDRGQQFLKDNFAETFTRGGGEPALVEASQRGAVGLGKVVVPEKIVRAGFALARRIDQRNAQATVLGNYFRALKEKGIDPSTYDQIPVDKEAQAQALVAARRSVASPLPKDVPMALSRGALTGGNVSIGRSILQFQNIFLDQWSNIRHDLFRAGIVEKNPKLAAQMTLAFTAMIVAETGIRVASKEAVASMTGSHPKKEKDIGKKVAIETLRRFPFMAQFTAMALYGESGVPALDSIKDTVTAGYRATQAKKASAQDKAAIRAVGGVGQLLGVPGSSQAAEILEKAQ